MLGLLTDISGLQTRIGASSFVCSVFSSPVHLIFTAQALTALPFYGSVGDDAALSVTIDEGVGNPRMNARLQSID